MTDEESVELEKLKTSLQEAIMELLQSDVRIPTEPDGIDALVKMVSKHLDFVAPQIKVVADEPTSEQRRLGVVPMHLEMSCQTYERFFAGFGWEPIAEKIDISITVEL